jgi:hypothetical protein
VGASDHNGGSPILTQSRYGRSSENTRQEMDNVLQYDIDICCHNRQLRIEIHMTTLIANRCHGHFGHSNNDIIKTYAKSTNHT